MTARGNAHTPTVVEYLTQLRTRTVGMSARQLAIFAVTTAAPEQHGRRPAIRTVQRRFRLARASSKQDLDPAVTVVLAHLPPPPSFSGNGLRHAAAAAIRIWLAEQFTNARRRSEHHPLLAQVWRTAWALNGWARPRHHPQTDRLQTPLRRFFCHLQSRTAARYGHHIDPDADVLEPAWILWPTGRQPGTKDVRLARHLRDLCREADHGQPGLRAAHLTTTSMTTAQRRCSWVPDGADTLLSVMRPRVDAARVLQHLAEDCIDTLGLDEAYAAAVVSQRLLGLLLWLRRWEPREQRQIRWTISRPWTERLHASDLVVDALTWHVQSLPAPTQGHPLDQIIASTWP